MQGKIIKGIAGFYYVQTKTGVYECKAKGSFRNRKLKPLVGDNVEITVLNEEDKKGNMEEILERKNSLIRPAVANVDQALVIFAAAKPSPNLNLLDRFLVMMERNAIPVILVFNKKDVAEKEETARLVKCYESCGYHVFSVSALMEEGISELKEILKGKTTTVAGPSGVGKSSIINLLQSGVCMETGSISEKIERGKHTTRHAELIAIEEDSYIFDTPGFSSLYVPDMEKEELKDCFPEFVPYEGGCRFLGCVHIHEPSCLVKEALEEGKISRSRYENYILMYEELKEKEKRKYS
ncbi:MAG: ribosome small subunit-dependent GTPase A [Lachnospiraceae bacterium]